jgi:hypothetical protein
MDNKDNMNVKDIILTWLALLAILATGFISIRSEMQELTIHVAKNGAKIDSIKEYCCDE